MNTEDTHKILQEFDAIELIVPSNDWTINFDNKLNASRRSKSRVVSKFNLIVVILVLLNVGFIWSTFKADHAKAFEDRGSKFQIIADELLINSNN